MATRVGLTHRAPHSSGLLEFDSTPQRLCPAMLWTNRESDSDRREGKVL